MSGVKVNLSIPLVVITLNTSLKIETSIYVLLTGKLVPSLWSIESENTDLPTPVLKVVSARNQWIHAALQQTAFVRF